LIFLRQIEDVTQTDLWRLPFLLSIVIIAVAFWMRLKLKESPQFSALKAKHQVARQPLRDLLKSSSRTLGIVVGLRMAENGGSSIYQTLAVSYIVTVMGAPGAVGSVSLLAAALVGAAVVPVAGLLTDRYGRVPVYRGFAFFQLLAAVPVWWVLSQGNPVASIVACSVAFAGVSGMFGSQGALLPELFGARHRYIGVSAARETSAVIAGGVAPLIGALLIAWSARELGSPSAAWMLIAAYLCLLTTITLLTTFVTPEPRGRDLGDLNDAVRGKRNGDAP
jgi:MHS family metabolite:H+ symporter-like MFS transporter